MFFLSGQVNGNEKKQQQQQKKNKKKKQKPNEGWIKNNLTQ